MVQPVRRRSHHLNNAGTITRTVGTGTAGLDEVIVNGAGPINVNTGTLRLSDSAGAAVGALTGAMTIANGATLDFGGGVYNLTGGATIGGAGGNLTVSGSALTTALPVTATGALTVSSGTANFNANATPLTPSSVTVSGNGTANFNRTLTDAGALTIPSGTANFNVDSTVAGALTLSGGTLAGSNMLTVNGNGSVWSDGAMLGTGSTVLSGTNTLAISGAATKVFRQRTLTTGGVTTWSGGAIQGQDGGTFNNNGTFDVQTDLTWFNQFGGAATTLNNAGTITRTVGTGTAGLDAVTVNNTATGTIDVQTGTLRAVSFPTNAGMVNIAAGATLNTNGASLINAATGTIGGNGTLSLTNPPTNSLTGTLTNHGILRPGTSPGTLTITGNLTQGPGGRVNIELGGTAPGNFDVLAVSGTATLDGTLNVSTTGGYNATGGDNFTVLTAGSVQGAFATVNKTFGNSITTTYNPTSLQLTLGAAGLINRWNPDADGFWNVAGNWDQLHVPVAGEQVLIDVGGGTVRTITVPAGTFVADLLTSNENIVIGGGSLSLASASTINASLAVNSGTLQGTGQITVNGPLSFTGGTIASTGGVIVNGTTSVNTGTPHLTGVLRTNVLNMTGPLSIAASGVLSLVGGSSTITGTTLTNAGTVRVISTGNLLLENGAILDNSGTLDFQTNVGVQYPRSERGRRSTIPAR